MYLLDIKGRYKDTLTWQSFSGSQKVEHRDWEPNQIQDGATFIISERITGVSEGQVSNPFSGYVPIRYLALGSGVPASKPYDSNRLMNEFERVTIAYSDFTFLDDQGADLSPQVASGRFKVDLTLRAGEGNGSLTEFGLFGGRDATSTINTGTMFNWVTHPLIVKDHTLIINRVIDISLSINRS